MIAKSLIAAAAVAVSVAGFSATSANAGKWDVDINLYPDYGYGYDVGYPVYDGHVGHHPRPPHHVSPVSWGVSCGEAKWEVKSRHFKNVKTLDCSGKTYTFSGWKHGDKYRIKVGRKHGQIISVSEIY